MCLLIIDGCNQDIDIAYRFASSSENLLYNNYKNNNNTFVQRWYS